MFSGGQRHIVEMFFCVIAFPQINDQVVANPYPHPVIGFGEKPIITCQLKITLPTHSKVIGINALCRYAILPFVINRGFILNFRRITHEIDVVVVFRTELSGRNIVAALGFFPIQLCYCTATTLVIFHFDAMLTRAQGFAFEVSGWWLIFPRID